MVTITGVAVTDIRVPTSLRLDGSDAMHTDPDYSCAYVQVQTSTSHIGYGLAFTLGRGTEIVVSAINALKHIILGVEVEAIFNNFAMYWRNLTSESQLRWVGPEKGVIHLACAALVNALWDLWARMENKPLWKLLSDMEPEQLVNTIDFRYITDLISKEEAIRMLKEKQSSRKLREEEVKRTGYPAYTTQAGWLGYSDDKVENLCKKYLESGFKAFKIKVGQNLKQDQRRCELVRKAIGNENQLMLDANQVWDVAEAVEWCKKLAVYKPLWIEEPTSPDDILGHAHISKMLKPFGIGVATGEMCANRVIFKQLLKAEAIEFCQIDACRLGGVNEVLAVYLMANKLSVKVCPHAGGIGLCEMVQHLQIWDFICLSASKEGRFIEYVDQQHEHFTDPVKVKDAAYLVPSVPGYSCQMKTEAVEEFEYPCGRVWNNSVKNTK